MRTGLTQYEATKRQLASLSKVDEVKAIRDKALAMQVYAKQAKDTLLIGYATEIRLRAERRAGELWKNTEKNKGTRGTARGSTNGSGGIVLQPPEDATPTLAALGITKTQASKWVKLADLPENKYEEKVEKAKRKAEDSTTSSPRHAKSEFTGDNEWYTPAEYIEAVRAFLGAIDVDPASSSHAQLTVRAGRFYSKEDDGLTQEWRGRIWLNPPYAQPVIQHFAEKMVAEVRSGRVTEAIMLTHNYTDTQWFHTAQSASTAICFTRGRIAFIDADGNKAAPTQGQAFFYYGKRVNEFVAAFSPFGFVVRAA